MSWPQTDLSVRLDWLAAFRRAVLADADELCRLMQFEVGKPPWEGLTADIFTLLAHAKWHQRHAAALLRPRRARGGPLLMSGIRVWQTRAPLGRVGIIATWNYPVQLLGIQLIQALLAGNRVLVKPSEHAPRTQTRLLHLAVACGLPEGTLEWTPATRDAGPELLNTGNCDHIVFTGSTAVGREIAAWAGPRLVPTTLELSGCDSALVLADADPALAASCIWQGLTFNAGQTCMAPRRALVDRCAYPAFTRELAAWAAGARPLRLITPAAAARVFDLASAAARHGARSASAVLERPGSGRLDADPRWLRPIAMLECPRDAELLRGEHFGPAIAVVPVDGLDDALTLHRRVAQHLSASVFTRDLRAARALAPLLGCTQVNVNDCVIPTAHPGTSIGGHGPSGWGLSRGPDGLLAMTRPVFVSSTGRFRPPPGPPAPAALTFMRRALRWLYGPASPIALPHPADAPHSQSHSPEHGPSIDLKPHHRPDHFSALAGVNPSPDQPRRPA